MLMMGGGITLRHLVVHPGAIGAGIMGALYLGIGSALFIADRVFWHAVVEEFAGPGVAPESRHPTRAPIDPPIAGPPTS
jgi:hypothetical protein